MECEGPGKSGSEKPCLNMCTRTPLGPLRVTVGVTTGHRAPGFCPGDSHPVLAEVGSKIMYVLGIPQSASCFFKKMNFKACLWGSRSEFQRYGVFPRVLTAV